MTLFTLVLSILGYAFAGMFVKTYYKLYRCDPIMPEDAYIIGIFWPIYIAYRLLAAPLGAGSKLIEAKMVALTEAKSSTKEEPRVRVSDYDKELREAEQEVESMLAQERSNSL